MNELEALQFNCELKAGNIKTATETLIIKGFNDLWALENYLDCLQDGAATVKTLIQNLKIHSLEKQIE